MPNDNDDDANNNDNARAQLHIELVIWPNMSKTTTSTLIYHAIAIYMLTTNKLSMPHTYHTGKVVYVQIGKTCQYVHII